MIEINEKEARRLIVSGLAGYWSIHNKTVVLEHDVQSVIRLRGKWFLAPFSEFQITFICEAGVIGGKLKGAFNVLCENEEIAKMAVEEMSEKSVSLDCENMRIVPDDSHKWN